MRKKGVHTLSELEQLYNKEVRLSNIKIPTTSNSDGFLDTEISIAFLYFENI